MEAEESLLWTCLQDTFSHAEPTLWGCNWCPVTHVPATNTPRLLLQVTLIKLSIKPDKHQIMLLPCLWCLVLWGDVKHCNHFCNVKNCSLNKDCCNWWNQDSSTGKDTCFWRSMGCYSSAIFDMEDPSCTVTAHNPSSRDGISPSTLI